MFELFVSQFDGCTFKPGGYNCTCACEASWLYRASQGKIHQTSCAVRTETRDRDGGTNLGQMEAVSTAHGITTGKRYMPAAVDFLFGLIDTNRYAAHYNVCYEPFVGTPYDRFHGRFKENHDIILSGRGHDPDHLRVGDPGAQGFVDIPKSLLRQAGGMLLLNDAGTETINSEYGRGKAFAYVTPADPPTPLTLYHFRIASRSPIYRAPETAMAGHIDSGSGPCRKYKVNGHLWFQIVKPGSPVNGRYLHAGPTIVVTPI